MRVLAIGNSFSQDATRYLHDIAKADGETLEVITLYIGGCTLERHYRNMLSGEAKYELQYDGHPTNFFISLDDALLNRPWDVVTVQQASGESFKPDSYTPYIQELAEHIRLCVEHGRAVLCEKSFTGNAAQAEEVLALARARGVLVAEAIWTRYMPSRQIINDLLRVFRRPNGVDKA